jgi:hypothetical protein
LVAVKKRKREGRREKREGGSDVLRSRSEREKRRGRAAASRVELWAEKGKR